MDKENWIIGRNPVWEALKQGRQLEEIWILEGQPLEGDNPLGRIRARAAQQGVAYKTVSKERMAKLAPLGRCQGVAAKTPAYDYVELEELWDRAREKGEPAFFLFLDGVEDPHNLGAILRSANGAGAHGVVIPKDRAVGLTAVVAKTSAGAINYTPVAKVTNLSRAMEECKARGMWFVGADSSGSPMYQVDMRGPLGLVIGSEGRGLGQLVSKRCDFLASIPMRGEMESLNASVAAGILAYEALRQRMADGRG